MPQVHRFFTDAQSALAFIRTQATYIETEVNKIEYPDVQYQELVPVDFSAPEWVKSVTYTSQDRVGKAQWFHHMAKDIPRADVNRQQFETAVDMAAIGYGYTTEELAQAQMLSVPLEMDRAEAARISYEEFVDDVALRGDTVKAFSGLLNYPGITAVTVAADGTGSATFWSTKTVDQILRDFNSGLTGIRTATNTVGYADTVLLPYAVFDLLATKRLDATLQMTILDWLKTKNVLTATTGRPLVIRAVRGLETIGVGTTARAIFYRRDKRVLKMHIPMPHKFLEPMRTAALMWEVPGIFRLGGLDVKLPKMIYYLDGI